MVISNDNASDSAEDVCHYGDVEDESDSYNGDYDWDELTQSLIIGSFFWGYIWTQIPGGRLAEVIGPVRVYGYAILGSAILTFLIPVMSNIGPAEVMVIRILMGLSQSPKVPWKSVVTSVPFYAIIVAGFGNNWGFYTLVTDLPLYMKNMLRKDINANAALSGLPYLGMWIFSLIISAVADTLRRKNVLTTTWVRKIATLIAHGGPAICLFSLSLVECDRTATIIILCLAVTLQGALYTGWMINHIDIAPNFAGTLCGITNAISSIPAWVAPVMVGALTTDNQTFEQWRKVFYIAGGIYAFDAVFFLIFSTGEEQAWNKVKKDPAIPREGETNLALQSEVSLNDKEKHF